MARLISEGFESGDFLFWDTHGGSETSSTGRIDGKAYFISSSTSTKLFTASTEVYAKLAFSRTANTLVFGFRNGATEYASVRFNSTSNCFDIYINGSLQTAGTMVIATSTWYVMEIHVKIADSGGVCEYKIDGILQPSFTGDTKPSTGTTVNTFTFNAASGSCSIDDLAINDTSGGADNTWIGDSHFYSLFPNGNGSSSQFVGSDGNSTDNYALVDERPSNGDTDYVQSATSTNKDLYAVGNITTLPTGSLIKRVIVETRARELTADGQSINLGVKSGSTESWSSNITVATSYAMQTAEFVVDPDTGAAWTESAVNAMEIGVKIP